MVQSPEKIIIRPVTAALLTLAIASSAAAAATTAPPPQPQRSALRYDYDYPVIGYAERPTHNRVARLQERVASGAVKLTFDNRRGYLDSLLRALEIDASSQTLVFSKTSLQVSAITAATPRAIYFNEDTYVAWVQGTNLLEFTTMDSALGPVFYTLVNQTDPQPSFDRETSRCLACHDTFSMMGGGVPRFLLMSSFVDANGEPVTNDTSSEIADDTPIQDRWAGWYVTGQHGAQTHLGNIMFRATDFRRRNELKDGVPRHGNLDTLAGLLDTHPYLTDKSDIVALLVLEHQLNIENLITRANFKSRTLLARDPDDAEARTWNALSPKMQRTLHPMLDTLVRAMLSVNTAPITDRIISTSGFDKWFQSRGPHDNQGRSLRQLDLQTRVFTYPLSYVIYSDGFDGLPECARDYIYQRLHAVLTGDETNTDFAHITAADRKATLEILTATKPEFARGISG